MPIFGLCLGKVRKKILSYKARREEVVRFYPEYSIFSSYGSFDYYE